jgi:hypothetical protein
VNAYFEDTGFGKDKINTIINAKNSYKYVYKTKADGSYIILVHANNELYIMQVIM